MIIIAHEVCHFHYDTETCFMAFGESAFIDRAGTHNGFHKLSFIDQTNQFMGHRSENATSRKKRLCTRHKACLGIIMKMTDYMCNNYHKHYKIT